MSLTSLPRRPLPVRLVGALFAVTLLAAGCSAGSDPAAEDSSAASGESATSDDGGDGESDGTVVADTSDGGGQTAASMPVEPIAVTPAPDGFEPPAACSGEGAYFAEVGESSTPDLPERDGETLTIEATGHLRRERPAHRLLGRRRGPSARGHHPRRDSRYRAVDDLRDQRLRED